MAPVTPSDAPGTDPSGTPALTPGFRGRPRPSGVALPPGQHEVHDFPVLSAGPTPNVDTAHWQLEVRTEDHATWRWTWGELMALPQEDAVVDLHCVTRWSKFGTRWRGVSLDVLLADVPSAAQHALVGCYGGYTTNLPVADLLGGRAWIAHTYDGRPLDPLHGGPARLLVPHLYLWKSAKWVRSITLLRDEQRGFWERYGYHDYGDPWREQRYQGD